MNWKKIGFNLLYPHIAWIICLLPISVAFLVFSLIYLSSTSVVAIFSYLLSFYVLLIICFRMPKIIKFLKNLKDENKFLKKWFTDVHLRVNVTLYGSLIWNVAFAILQLGLGFYHKSFWFYSMFSYYVILAIMRFFLVKHTTKYKANEQTEVETKKYILCGWLLLLMNLTLSVIIFFIVYLNQTFNHHMITTIAMATYTFLTLSFAIVNIIKYRKYKSPVYSAAKSISFIAACVSMLTLETTMITSFGEQESPLFRQIMLSLTGIAVIAIAITLAIIMIVKGNNQLKIINNERKKGQSENIIIHNQ